MNINLHIERLVLEGLPVETRQAGAMKEAVEAELVRLLTEYGLSAELQTGGRYPRLQGQAIQLNPGSPPPQLGAQVGRTIFGSIGPETVKE